MIFILKTEAIKQNAIEYINSLDVKQEIAVEFKKKSRSLPQNSLFHKWVGIMASEIGYSPEEMKTAIKRTVLGMKDIINPLTGEVITVDYETSKLNKEEFSMLMNETQRLAVEYGIALPSPDYYGVE